MQTLMLGVYPSEIGATAASRILPTWGVSSYPTIVDITMQLQGTSTIHQQNLQEIIAFIDVKPQTFIIYPRIHMGQGNLSLKKGLPSLNILKGQTNQYILAQAPKV